MVDNKIQYYVFDLDGTLLNSKKEILPNTLLEIEKLRIRNKKVGIATGRPYYFARKEISILNPDFPIVSCNGSIIYNHKNSEILYSNSFSKELTQEILNILVKNKCTFLIYTSKQMYKHTINLDSNWFNWLDSYNLSLEIENRFKIAPFKSFALNENDVIKFLIIENETDLFAFELAKNALNKLNDIYVVKSQENVLDIMPKGVSKGEALKIIQTLGYLNLEETITFGDAHNDIPMFGVSKQSVAMGQAQQTIKDCATFETKSNDEDGIAFFLRNFPNKNDL